MRGWPTRLVVCFATLALGACATGHGSNASPPEREAIAARMMADIEVLSSEAFGGRMPGTPGEEQTVAYLIERMQEAGLVSGTNDPGSVWRAPVELIRTRALDSRIIVRTQRGETEIGQGNGFAFTSTRRALIDGVDVVFVGKEAETVPAEAIAGRIVVLLDDPALGSGQREHLFEAGPAAIITVVDDAAAIAERRQALGGERLTLASEDTDRLLAFVTDEALSAAFPEGRWSALVDRATAAGFEPEMLNATIAIDAHTTRREFTSSNVLGLIPGAVKGAGAVVLMGHWDHLGECAPEASDRLCNGAVDNASGIALMLELAARLRAIGPHDRDIYLLATSAEEAGLLGAKAFAQEPPLALNDIVAVFNFDMVAIAPRDSPVGFIGEGETPLDDIVLQTLSETGRKLGERDFAANFLRRQDGWALLEQGIPAVLISTTFGSESLVAPFLAEDYHKPSDDGRILQLGGAIDDLLLHEELVRRVASTATYTPPERQGVVIVESGP